MLLRWCLLSKVSDRSIGHTSTVRRTLTVSSCQGSQITTTTIRAVTRLVNMSAQKGRTLLAWLQNAATGKRLIRCDCLSRSLSGCSIPLSGKCLPESELPAVLPLALVASAGRGIISLLLSFVRSPERERPWNAASCSEEPRLVNFLNTCKNG